LGNEKLDRLEALIRDILNPNYLTRIGSDEFYFSISNDFDSNKNNIFNLLQLVKNKLGFTISIGITEEKDLLPESIINRLKHNTQIAKINGKNKLYIK
jgi:GGDEF domain-containing protein